MFSSSKSPRSKPSTHRAAPTTQATSVNPANLNTSASYPNAYPPSNAYTRPIGGVPLPTSTSTPPAVRLRATPRPTLEHRDSVLRASILDTALELGVGTSSAVQKWMFDPIGEVEEDVDETTVSPSLTYASTATSDESWLHSSTSSSSQQSAGQRPRMPAVVSNRTVQFAPLRQSPIDERDTSFDSSIAPTPEDIHPSNYAQSKGNKLRKARPSQDGYASDGGDGYVSESGTGTKVKAKKASKKEKKEKGEESDGGYLSDVLSRRKRNKDKKKGKTKPGALNLETDLDGDGEETDGGYLSSGVASFVRSRKSSTSKPKTKSKSKSKSNDPDTLFSPQSGAEDSDGGYLSSNSSKKRRFFRLKRNDSEDVPRSSKESIPPVPALPMLALSSSTPASGGMSSRSVTPLPIAERFVSRSTTPLSRAETATPSTSISLDIPNGYSVSSRSTTPVSPALTRPSESSEFARPNDLDRLAPFVASPSASMTSMASLDSPRLTHAFGDAESVRSPSVDVLRAFGRQAGLNLRDADLKAYLSGGAVDRVRDEEKSSLASTSYGSLRSVAENGGYPFSLDTHISSEVEATAPDAITGIPTLNLPGPTAKIKRTMSKRQVPAPLTSLGVSASSRGVNRHDIRSYEVLKVNAEDAHRELGVEDGNSTGEDGDWDAQDLTVDVTPATPSSDRSRLSGSAASTSPTPRPPSPSMSSAGRANVSSSPVRPNALGKYDIPPPSPPPSRPLPRVPPSPPLSSPTVPLPATPESPTRANLSIDSKASLGKRPAPSSPLGKSSFSPEDIQPPSLPSPSTPNFLSRKLAKRPDTAPVSPGLSAVSLTATTPSASASPRAETSALSSPPSASTSAIARAFRFGRSAKTSPRPGTAPTTSSPAGPPTFTGASSPFLSRTTSNTSVTSLGGSAIQRGRESPFPSKPVLQVSSRQQSRAASPVPNLQGPPASAGPVLQRSTSSNAIEQNGDPVRTLDVNWQPRSASALDSRSPAMSMTKSGSPALTASMGEDEYDDRSSWVDFDDSEDEHDVYTRDSKFSSGDKKDGNRESVVSYESHESKPDITSVLDTLDSPDRPELGYARESRYSRADERSVYPEDDDYDDPRERDTAYFTSMSTFPSDAEDMPPVPNRPKGLTVGTAGRYSTSPSLSPSEFEEDEMDDVENRKSHASFMDGKRSERVRQKLMKRVEQMRRDGEQGALM